METPTLTSVMRVLVATVGLVAVGGVMYATYERIADPSSALSTRWALFALWTLVLPGVWGLRLGRRLARLAGHSPRPGALAAALAGLWLELLALGLGAAVAALAVIRAS